MTVMASTQVVIAPQASMVELAKRPVVAWIDDYAPSMGAALFSSGPPDEARSFRVTATATVAA